MEAYATSTTVAVFALQSSQSVFSVLTVDFSSGEASRQTVTHYTSYRVNFSATSTTNYVVQ